MRLNKILSLVLPVALVVVVAADQASAQARALRGGSSPQRENFFKHSSVNINLRLGGGFYGGSFYRPTCYTPPVVIVEPCRRWIPAFYETQCVQVWIPGCGCERQVWIEPVYQTICEPCCGTRQVLVTAGYFRTVTENAGHYETRQTQVLIPGHFA